MYYAVHKAMNHIERQARRCSTWKYKHSISQRHLTAQVGVFVHYLALRRFSNNLLNSSEFLPESPKFKNKDVQVFLAICSSHEISTSRNQINEFHFSSYVSYGCILWKLTKLTFKKYYIIILHGLPPPRNSLAFSSRVGSAKTRAEISVHRPTATTDATSSSHSGDTSRHATSCSTVVCLVTKVILYFSVTKLRKYIN